MLRITAVFLMLAAMLACGGGGGGGSTSSGSRSTATSPPGQAVTIGVSGGQTTGGIDITVPSTAPGTNAQFLGVATPGSNSVTLTNTSAAVHRGTTMIVMLLGTGLSGNMTVQLSGPQDISIAAITSVPAQGTTPPGIQFTATIPSNAALGGRSVFLVSGNDLTAFAGGLEVLP